MVGSVDRYLSEDVASQEELICKLRMGDRQARSDLVKRYGDQLWRFIYKQTGNYQDASDVFQQTWQRFFERISSNNFVIKGGGLLAFLYTVASNIRKDDCRQSVVRQYATGILARQNVSASKENPVEAVTETERKEMLALALSKLPENQYQVIKLRYYDNLKFEKSVLFW